MLRGTTARGCFTAMDCISTASTFFLRTIGKKSRWFKNVILIYTFIYNRTTPTAHRFLELKGHVGSAVAFQMVWCRPTASHLGWLSSMTIISTHQSPLYKMCWMEDAGYSGDISNGRVKKKILEQSACILEHSAFILEHSACILEHLKIYIHPG